MTRKLLDSIEITTGNTTEYSVIWLHGLGASGHDFEPIVPELKLLNRPGVRFIFPHAPVRPITVNGGASMRGWYDIATMDFDQREQDVEGTLASYEAVDDLIQNEISRGVAPGNIVLAGFSQGGAIALYTALTHELQLGGVLALSTYLPLQDTVLEKWTQKNRSLPIMMAHGSFDDVIPISVANQTRDFLNQHNLDLEWFEYAIAHSVSSEEIQQMSVWFKRVFGM